MPRGIPIHHCTWVLLSFTIFYRLICILQFFKEVVNYKGYMYEGRRISAYSKTCFTLHATFCKCCTVLKQIARGTHFIFLCIQVHFPDVERVEWLNKVRSSELQLVRPPALSCIPPIQTLWDKSEKVIKLLQFWLNCISVCTEVWSHLSVGLPLRLSQPEPG